MSSRKAELVPPEEALMVARSVMGAIDFDPWTTADTNQHVLAARIHDKRGGMAELLVRPWEVPNQGRVFLAATDNAKTSRPLLNKVHREYQMGRLSQAVIWLAHNETLTRAPWLWDFPVCLPFRRLRPRFYDDELEKLVPVAPSDWSVLIYLPPCSPPQLFAAALSRFHVSAATVGRIVLDEGSGRSDWPEGYKAAFGKAWSAQG